MAAAAEEAEKDQSNENEGGDGVKAVGVDKTFVGNKYSKHQACV